jgi:GTP cyclohydrolase II
VHQYDTTIRVPTAAGLIDVERAIAETRAGRPVVLLSGGEISVVTGVEALDEALAATLGELAQGAARLTLAGPRLRRLGLERVEPGALSLPTLDIARILALAIDANARIDAPVAPTGPLDDAALELLRLALVLPAAVVVSLAGDAPRGLLAVEAADALGYRLARAASLRIVSRAPTPLDGAPNTEFVVFRGGEGLRDQVAVVIGDPDPAQPVAVRLHSACLTGDLFGSLKCDCGDQLRGTARAMAENGGGVLLYLDQEGRGSGLANKIRAYDLQRRGYDTFDADETLGFEQDHRGFDFAAAMLKALGLRAVRIMTNNPAKIAALREAGIDVVEDIRVTGRRTAQNIRYLAAKRDRAGHLLDSDL